MPKPNEAKKPRTQAQRRAETRNLLLDTARDLFLANGYDQTGMPELVKRAGLTRGALYHHFSDKADLFNAIARRDAEQVGKHIYDATLDLASPEEGMMVGTKAYFAAMANPGTAEILQIMAPAILGLHEAQKLTYTSGSAELKDGLSAAMPNVSPMQLEALTEVLSAAFDRAALKISQGEDETTYIDALFKIMQELLGE